MNHAETFRKRLFMKRGSRGWTQEDLAKRCGLHTTAIAQFETGRRKPSFNNLIKISKGLNVSIDWLMGLNQMRDLRQENF